MSNRSLINMLKAGNQEPVTLNFHNLRLKEQFAGFVSKKLEPDSVSSILRLLDSGQFAAQYGFTTPIIFIRCLYQTRTRYIGTPRPRNSLKRMYANYQAFWTPERKQKARSA